MASAENTGFELMLDMVDQFGKSYEEITSHRSSLPQTNTLFEDIKQHFSDIQNSLKQKLDELESKTRAFEEKKATHSKLLKEREADVTEKEQALFDRLQVLRDAAVSDIVDARTKNNVVIPVLENKVSASANDALDEPFSSPDENVFVNESSHLAKAMAGRVEPRPQLKQICEQMNFKGLLKVFSDNRKFIAPIRDELPLALKSVSDPAYFVLKTLEEFYPQSSINQNSKENLDLQILRRTCLLLMESVASLFAMDEQGDDHLLSSEIKNKAKEIADEWRCNLAKLIIDDSDDHTLEAQAFLQLLVTFRISSEFGDDELCKFVIAMSRRRRQAPELCRAVGLAHKSKDVAETLIAKGRLIDAAHFTYFFQLTETIPLVPLLKRYLEEVEDIAARSIASGLEKEAANQELNALKNVIRCIEEYKLQGEYPLSDLQTRIDHLEKITAGNKRRAEASKSPLKRRRANDKFVVYNNPFPVHDHLKAPMNFDHHQRTRYYAGHDRFAYTTAPSPYEFSGYAQPYGHQANPPRPYHYANERAPPYNAPSNYGNYFGPPMQPPALPVNMGNYVSSGMQAASFSHGNSMPSAQQPYM